MSTTITPPAETIPAVSQPVFDFIANRERIRAEEKAKRDGKVTVIQPPEAKVPVVAAPEVPVEVAPVVAAPEAPVIPEVVAPPAAEPATPEKRASGRERNFKKQLSQRDREIGALTARLDALAAAQVKPEAPAAPVVTGKVPARADFTTDEDFRRAEIQFEAKKVIDEARAADAQDQAIQETAATYGERMSNGPKKYDDWKEKLDGTEGTFIATFDLMDEKNGCLPLLGAILSSPYPEDCFYHWFNKPEEFKSLVETYRSSPRGAEQALQRFWMLSGRVGKDGIPEKKKPEVVAAPVVVPPAPVVAPPVPVAEKPPIPRPSSSVEVRGGTPAGDGPPPVKIPGTNMMNPLWQAWNRANSRR